MVVILIYSTFTLATIYHQPTEGAQGQLASHCMVPAYSGTKMVVFGGWKPAINAPNQVPTYSSALYMLDVKSMNWTLLSDGEVNGRRNMACTVVGDNFVTWGGMCNNWC